MTVSPWYHSGKGCDCITLVKVPSVLFDVCCASLLITQRRSRFLPMEKQAHQEVSQLIKHLWM